MAVDMFLNLDGVKGESQDKSHTKEIDILGWSWGMSNSGSAHVGGGAGSGKVSVQDLSVTKYLDSSSAQIMLSCCEGTHFGSALLTVRKAGGDKPVEYLTIKLQEVLITSVSTGASGGDDRLTENVTLNFAKVKVEYLPQEAKGGKGNMIPFGWNIAGNDDEV
jgi:type VI secretion system secreted protein Hcp